MKTKTVYVLMVCFLSSCSGAWADQKSSPQQDLGKIEFAQKMDGDQQPGGRQCTIMVQSQGQKDNKMKDTACKNDVVTFFRFVDVASTTEVQLSSESKCWGEDWTFNVQAIKNPTTTKWIDIRTFSGKPKGTIIQPGLMLVYSRHDWGNIEGKLSCASVYAPGYMERFKTVPEGSRP
ncbi:hypothetical protein [Pseudomonas alloputida]|uniref:hypothetical protein n=1 Tax=Pseudomonas TaxID=286 RepID=UPI003EEE6ADF